MTWWPAFWVWGKGDHQHLAATQISGRIIQNPALEERFTHIDTYWQYWIFGWVPWPPTWPSRERSHWGIGAKRRCKHVPIKSTHAIEANIVVTWNPLLSKEYPRNISFNLSICLCVGCPTSKCMVYHHQKELYCASINVSRLQIHTAFDLWSVLHCFRSADSEAENVLCTINEHALWQNIDGSC